MRSTGLYIIILIVAILSFLRPLSAQIFSAEADHIKVVDYPVDTNQVQIFTFYNPPGIDVVGSLSAAISIPGNYNFEWRKFNPDSGEFDQLLLSHNGLSVSHLTNLTAGGYQVRIFNEIDLDTLFHAWVHIDKLRVSIVKDGSNHLLQSAFTCDYLTLSGSVNIDTFFYYDPVSKEEIILQNGYTFLWTSDNDKLRIPNASKVLDPNTTYKPPYLDTWYILTATDSFGMEDVDSVFYESIQVGPYPEDEPWFGIQVFDARDKEEFVDQTIPYEGESPLKVKFINQTINAHSWEWIYSDTARSDLFANEFTSDSAYQPEYTYLIPNDYYPMLIASSEAGCIDTFGVTEPITVLPSELEVPNVFTPDGNTQNDYFKVKFRSIREFSIRIFDRSGKLVYKADVKDMYQWEGWDGNVLGTNRKASPGAYFYVIDAYGWDDKHYYKNQFRGVVYLYRNEE